MFRHFNDNIDQANVRPDPGPQPPDLHPQAENILVIGSDSRPGTAAAAADSTDQSDTLMLVHIPASRQWAEVMSVVSSLISRARSKPLDPLAIYRFLNAATSSLTVDSQMGGIAGLYSLEQSLHGIAPSKIVFFTLPNFPRADVVPADTANVLWRQPEDSKIFASTR